MSFPRYESYKDSGIEWLGEVPEHWEVWKLAQAFENIGSGTTPKTENHDFYQDGHIAWVNTGDLNDSDLYACDKRITETALAAHSSLKVYAAGSLVIAMYGATIGKLAVLRFAATVNQACCVFSGQAVIHTSFLFYWFLGVRQHIVSMATGGGQPNISQEVLRNIRVPCPAQNEQITIAAFLNRETAKIDALIAEQQRLIELLKEKRQAVISHAVTKGLNPDAPMKDSGIEWLGEVPEHWEVKRLKFIANVQTGVAKGKDNTGKITIEVPYLRVANVQDGYLDLGDVATIELPVDDLQRYELQVNDVLMNEGGDFDKLGRGYIWDGSISPCIHQNHVFAVRPFGVSSDWLNLITGSSYAQFYFMSRSKQSTNLASISSTNIMELPVVVPPTDEQALLLHWIDVKALKFDQLIQDAGAAITLLQERRTALISAAVTGKIDVRGLVETQPEREAAA
ncbi:MAG: restriction endonuclease subunit S [Candidatus Competibacter denitrificans]|jgi:type I restriction enzyme S subunit